MSAECLHTNADYLGGDISGTSYLYACRECGDEFTYKPEVGESEQEWMRVREMPIDQMTEAEQEFAMELFYKRGIDDGGPISTLINTRLGRFLGLFCTEGTKTNFMQSEHNPRLVLITRPDGTEDYINDDWEKVPGDIKPKIAFFIRYRVPEILESLIDAQQNAEDLLSKLNIDNN